jgi:ribose 5-phosphate isomerase A
MEWIEKAKEAAVSEALKYLRNGQVIGLGSGSTAAIAIKEIGNKLRRGELKNIVGIPTSTQAFLLAIESGIPTTSLYEHPKIDLTIDGADQVDHKLNLIKGMGGALTREKIVASASEKILIVIDETKLTDKLGNNQVLPIEVLPFAAPLVLSKLRSMKTNGKIREGKGKAGPVVTDNGNFIIDLDAGVIENPKKLDAQLKSIPGVVETGLFIDLADIVFVGGKGSVKRLTR